VSLISNIRSLIYGIFHRFSFPFYMSFRHDIQPKKIAPTRSLIQFRIWVEDGRQALKVEAKEVEIKILNYFDGVDLRERERGRTRERDYRNTFRLTNFYVMLFLLPLCRCLCFYRLKSVFSVFNFCLCLSLSLTQSACVLIKNYLLALSCC